METNYKENCTQQGWKVMINEYGNLRITNESGQIKVAELSEHDTEQANKSNALLIAEAGTVLSETGFTPRELANQKQELVEALEKAMDCYNKKGQLLSFDVNIIRTALQNADKK